MNGHPRWLSNLLASKPGTVTNNPWRPHGMGDMWLPQGGDAVRQKWHIYSCTPPPSLMPYNSLHTPCSSIWQEFVCAPALDYLLSQPPGEFRMRCLLSEYSMHTSMIANSLLCVLKLCLHVSFFVRLWWSWLQGQWIIAQHNRYSINKWMCDYFTFKGHTTNEFFKTCVAL